MPLALRSSNGLGLCIDNKGAQESCCNPCDCSGEGFDCRTMQPGPVGPCSRIDITGTAVDPSTETATNNIQLIAYFARSGIVPVEGWHFWEFFGSFRNTNIGSGISFDGPARVLIYASDEPFLLEPSQTTPAQTVYWLVDQGQGLSPIFNADLCSSTNPQITFSDCCVCCTTATAGIDLAGLVRWDVNGILSIANQAGGETPLAPSQDFPPDVPSGCAACCVGRIGEACARPDAQPFPPLVTDTVSIFGSVDVNATTTHPEGSWTGLDSIIENQEVQVSNCEALSASFQTFNSQAGLIQGGFRRSLPVCSRAISVFWSRSGRRLRGRLGQSSANQPIRNALWPVFLS